MWVSLPSSEAAMSEQIRRFKLHRTADVSGISGLGYVAEGCQFYNGWIALTWYGKFLSLYWYPNMETLDGLHGHQGATKAEWIDAP